MSQPTLIEGVSVPDTWERNRRGLRHSRTTADRAANGIAIRGTEDVLPANWNVVRHVRELQAERQAM